MNLHSATDRSHIEEVRLTLSRIWPLTDERPDGDEFSIASAVGTVLGLGPLGVLPTVCVKAASAFGTASTLAIFKSTDTY